MNLSSINQFYQNALETLSTALASDSTNSTTSQTIADNIPSGNDTYEASAVSSDTVYSSDLYSDILDLIAAYKAQSVSSSEETVEGAVADSEASEDTDSANQAGGSGSGSENETTTETVVSGDGSIYLRTTTTANGVTTITETKLSGESHTASL